MDTFWRTSTLPQKLTSSLRRWWRLPSRLYVSNAPSLLLPMTSDSEGSVGWTQIAGSSIESPLVCTGTVSTLDGTSVGAADTTSTDAVVTTVTPTATTASVAATRIALICPPPVLTGF